MSYLNKPYEISVWEDVWRNERFEEQKICVIGSNTMKSQTRVFSPELTRNTNGTKRLTFQMYKKFVDAVTGEETINPFYDYLVSERKVKLYYKNKWHDFLIKGITETSKDYLYSYQLEDAMVHELSRNGYDVLFDEQLANNTGTALELGQKVMLGTDWTVESDLIVQTNEEALVWVQMPNDLSSGAVLKANRIKDADMSTTLTDFAAASHVLAFYSCCTGKPHRFQFIYLSDYTEEFVKKNSDRIIEMADCQYYKDYDLEEYEAVSGTEFFLPKGWTLSGRINNSSDSMPISHLYRGLRYGYGQEMIYHPGLDRYVSVWEQQDGTGTVYGYTKTEYNSPVFLTNYIVNSDLRSGSSGWYTIRSDGKVRSSEVVSGMFVGGAFKSVSDMTVDNIIGSDLNQFSTYLKIEAGQPFYNTGVTDNRKSLKLNPEDRLIVKGEFYLANGSLVPLLSIGCSLEEATVNSSGEYSLVSDPSNLTFTEDYNISENCFIFSQNRGQISEDDVAENTCFKIKFTAPFYLGTVYARNIQLFKEKKDKYGNLLTPDDTETLIDDLDVVVSKQVYFDPAIPQNGLNTKEEDLILSTGTSFIPKYRNKAEKARSISVKESNYFNILQTIAESFGVWLQINVEHNEDGTISNKKVKFSNYIGNDNYAGFRYGVNLKEITRTQESKNIVTKLIVKNNNNKYAKNGYCTVARANSNDSGETALYNFQYYHACGLLKAEDYTNYVYNASGALGKDIDSTHTSTNAKNFFKRLKAINTKLVTWNEELAEIKLELTSLRADQYTTETIRDSAMDKAATIARKFLANYQVTTIDQWPRVVQMTPDNDVLRSDAAKNQYFEWLQVRKTMEEADEKFDAINNVVTDRLQRQDGLEDLISQYTKYKEALQSAFYKQFNRFIQEGTWMSEEYTDDEKYYIDAQSTLYNSCYPKAQYSISVASLGGLDGYEAYDFDIGDRTYVQDEEFFGSNDRISVVVTETTENLDDPTRASIKVQNFKNEFQDLFQKITATVQQTQYSTGAYYKAVELAEADPNTKLDFLGDAFNSDTAVLSIGGQSTVTQDASGISIIDKTDPYQALRLLGGKILISRRDEQGNRYWATGLSASGLSADLITAGTINTSVLNIMNENSPAFRWDVHGISAFSSNDNGTYDRTKFTRFDKFGFYGISKESINGETWHPEIEKDITDNASFYLTWDGLKAYRGEIGGFSFDYIRLYSQQSPTLVQKALYYGLGEDTNTKWKTIKSSSFMLCPAGLRYERDLMGQTEVTWKLIIGTNFGVSSTGGLYARSANITGRIDATSGSFSEGCILGKNMVVGTWEDSFTSLSCGGATGITNLAALPTEDTAGILLAAAETVPCFALRGSSKAMCMNSTNLFFLNNSNGSLQQANTSMASNVYGFSVSLNFNQHKNSNGETISSGTPIKIWSQRGELEGTWLLNDSSIATSSDRNLKHDIKDLDEKYDVFFDLIVSKTFKYNNGTSNRDHCGFIAQEIQAALSDAGIFEQQFGAIIGGFSRDGEIVHYALRYEEFIALNTWQIQKLKPRMTAIEQEILKLKNEIQSLRAEIENLKKS